jgi:hypothetical protein
MLELGEDSTAAASVDHEVLAVVFKDEAGVVALRDDGVSGSEHRELHGWIS